MHADTATTLSSRERVQRAFNRQDHDRIPRYESFWNETIERWKEEAGIPGIDHALDTLGSDMQSLGWYWPQPFPGREEILEEDGETQVVKTPSGATLRMFKKRNSTPEHIDWECKTPEVWEEQYRDALVNQGIELDLKAANAAYKKAKRDDRWSFYPTVESFECLRAMVGDEHFLMAMIEEPEWIEEMASAFTDNVLRNLNALLESGVKPDGLWVYGDMAYNSGPFCSPAMYKELIWPQHRRFVEWAHEHDMHMIYHTDGDINRVMDLYVEAGFDALQPLEAKAGVDIRDLCPIYGKDLTFFGNIDVMKLAFGDLEEIEEEIRTKLEAGMATGSYIYHSDHTIPPQVPWERFLHIIECVETYGTY